jgi:RNA polymerase sporulation-specific sigma factor
MAEKELFYSKNNYSKETTDEELVSLCVSGDKEALDYLFHKYRDLVNCKVGKYFIIGAEKEDIIQEGMIGLYKAIKCFDAEKQKSFKAFANLCIERQLITAIKTSTRQKHMALNSYLSLNASAYEDNEDTSLMDVICTTTAEDPLDTLTKKEYYRTVENKIENSLSGFEKQVLQRFAEGDSYVKIAERLDSSVKSVDNAIQRIRKKTLNIPDEDAQ